MAVLHQISRKIRSCRRFPFFWAEKQNSAPPIISGLQIQAKMLLFFADSYRAVWSAKQFGVFSQLGDQQIHKRRTLGLLGRLEYNGLWLGKRIGRFPV